MKPLSLLTILFCIIFISLFFIIPTSVNAFMLENATPFNLQSTQSLPESFQNPNTLGGTPQQRISLDTWLKSKYLGIDITVSDIKTKVPVKATPLELISTKESFLFNVLDQNQKKYRVSIVFETNDSTTFQKQSRLDQTNPLGNARLQVEQYITQATQTILGAEPSSTSIYNPSMANTLQQSTAQDSGEPIRYRDAKTKSLKNGMLIISNNDIMLSDGSPLTIIFEKNNDI